MPWIGNKPNSDTPPGATHAFNRAQVLCGTHVVGIGIAEDTLNPGEFAIYLCLYNPETCEEFTVSAWVDEERTRPGWLEIKSARDSVCS